MMLFLGLRFLGLVKAAAARAAAAAAMPMIWFVVGESLLEIRHFPTCCSSSFQHIFDVNGSVTGRLKEKEKKNPFFG